MEQILLDRVVDEYSDIMFFSSELTMRIRGDSLHSAPVPQQILIAQVAE